MQWSRRASVTFVDLPPFGEDGHSPLPATRAIHRDFGHHLVLGADQRFELYRIAVSEIERISGKAP
jgi:hypothetical protein